MDYFVHESSYVDEGCQIGKGTKIWHFSHVMSNCVIGEDCNIGQNVVISPDVVLGRNCKIQNNVSVYTGVRCEDDVFFQQKEKELLELYFEKGQIDYDIQIFESGNDLLENYRNEYNIVFAETQSCQWKCIVGNVKKWKGDVLSLYNPEGTDEVCQMNLKASLVMRDGETSIVEFTWDNGAPFSKVLEVCGNIPIPPYLNRETESIDLERYQTIYARFRGSVAAPTAGLHFTERVRSEIRAKGIDMETVCLHVGAGTFLPVKSDNVAEHTMHREPFVVTLDFLEKLRKADGKVIAVGTTSVRTLESLYYAGVKCIEDGVPGDVDQWMPYSREYSYSTAESIDALIAWLKANGKNELSVGTRIIIVPGFQFRVVDILVTNFHQPQSTLLLLISAFVGGNWRPIYEYALGNGFRFLSYGDSSVLFRSK
mgnify:CR=1 FL=1